MSSSKGKAKAPLIEDEEDFDVDNMDFELPPELVSKPVSEFKSTSSSSLEMDPTNYVTMGSPTTTTPFGMNSNSPQQQQDTTKWQKLYPIYLDSTKSVTKGRRVPSTISTPHPNIMVMAFIVAELGFPLIVEPDKRHPKDPFLFGRLKVDLNGSTKSGAKMSKQALLTHIGTQYNSSKILLEESVKNGAPLLPPHMLQLQEMVDYSMTSEPVILNGKVPHPMMGNMPNAPPAALQKQTSTVSSESGSSQPISNKKKKKEKAAAAAAASQPPAAMDPMSLLAGMGGAGGAGGLGNLGAMADMLGMGDMLRNMGGGGAGGMDALSQMMSGMGMGGMGRGGGAGGRPKVVRGKRR